MPPPQSSAFAAASTASALWFVDRGLFTGLRFLSRCILRTLRVRSYCLQSSFLRPPPPQVRRSLRLVLCASVCSAFRSSRTAADERLFIAARSGRSGCSASVVRWPLAALRAFADAFAYSRHGAVVARSIQCVSFGAVLRTLAPLVAARSAQRWGDGGYCYSLDYCFSLCYSHISRELGQSDAFSFVFAPLSDASAFFCSLGWSGRSCLLACGTALSASPLRGFTFLLIASASSLRSRWSLRFCCSLHGNNQMCAAVSLVGRLCGLWVR